ncbi:hypothetical protein Pla175_48630 [Pirellulimonas nuda]|uniref:PEP-CTERM protein-sorting domain-containing protein n=1 Tax=Pirellulimonas nuda TaxID=2528009 RepID=A0A518DIX7_9BACT|nr:hypothetical protein [Pirellulimonas nuda]QDU91435.1 hypothetical protein Pla175_48630 [Pirellulimonas nuda]
MPRAFAVVLSLALAACCAQGLAQRPAEVLEHFHVVPRLSTLQLTGGFAGYDARYRLAGEYDFYHSAAGFGGAGFLNAQVYCSVVSHGPAPARVINVDQALNLSGLVGELLPLGAPFDVYRLTGSTAEGSSVELLAAMIGPWMYLRGGTQPPEGGADFFEYQLRAVARSQPFYDLNEDGVVDAADYTALRDGAAGSDLAGAGGYEAWSAQFGEAVPDFSAYDPMMALAASAAGLAAPVPEAVPEPSTLGLAAIVGAAGLGLLLLRGPSPLAGFTAR